MKRSTVSSAAISAETVTSAMVVIIAAKKAEEAVMTSITVPNAVTATMAVTYAKIA